jgi:hypothetical protein
MNYPADRAAVASRRWILRGAAQPEFADEADLRGRRIEQGWRSGAARILAGPREFTAPGRFDYFATPYDRSWRNRCVPPSTAIWRIPSVPGTDQEGRLLGGEPPSGHQLLTEANLGVGSGSSGPPIRFCPGLTVEVPITH